jgi:LTXXQ motif family protein
VGWGRRVVGLGFLIAADLCLAATPRLGHGDVTMLSPPWRASRSPGDLNGRPGLLLAAREQGTHVRSHSPNHHPTFARHAVAHGKARWPAPPRFHGGPNGVIDSPPLTRPGSPGREAGERPRRGGFIAWYGPVFWPYAYDDLFEYLLWPADDADYDGLFWVDAFAATIDPALSPDVAAGLPGRPLAPRSVARSRAGVRGLAGQSREFAEICGRRTPGRTGWPAERVRRTLDPTGAQEVALGGFKAATAAAATVLDNACVNEMPTSAVRRLGAIERRLDAMRQALAIIRPALDGLYGALDEAQKARLDGIALDPAAATNAAESTVSICGPSPPQPPPALPDIELKPPQRVALAALGAAIGAAVERLRAACPTPMPSTLPQRLSALQMRLDAMLAAVRIERPALAALADAVSREPTSPDIAPTAR